MEADSAKLIGAGLACIGMGGAGVGLGSLFGHYLAGAIRNPAAADGQFGRLIFGFAVTEALGIFSLDRAAPDLRRLRRAGFDRGGRKNEAAHAGGRSLSMFVTPSYAQTEPHAEPAAAEQHEGTEAHGGEHGAFPPFDPATFGSQLFWLAVCFGALYLLMSRVALPRIGAILETRNGRITGDLAEAARLKRETDAAIAAYEQALAEARHNAHAIAQKERDAAKAEVDANRARIEAELQARLDAAEAQIGEVKGRALADVDAIAKDAAEAMVELLIGAGIGKAEIAQAVDAALAERA